MNAFKLGDNIEALDEFGIWSKGTIVAIEEENFHISFDGFGSMWDHSVSAEGEIRAETRTQLPNKRSRQPKIIELQDGNKKEVAGCELCFPLQESACIPKTGEIREKRAKKRRTQDSIEDEVSTELPDNVDDQEEAETEQCLFIYFLQDNGMWLRVGDIVSVEGVGLPFIICRMCIVDGCVTAKLVNIHNSGLREDFVIMCNVVYIIGYSGGKVNLKGSVKEKVEQDAYVEFCNLLSCGVRINEENAFRSYYACWFTCWVWKLKLHQG